MRDEPDRPGHHGQAAAHLPRIDAIGVSPTHALFPSDHSHISPYSPSSRLFLNPLYADLALAGGEFAQDDGAGGLIDWPKASPEKFAAMSHAYQATGNNDAFRAFCDEGGDRFAVARRGGRPGREECRRCRCVREGSHRVAACAAGPRDGRPFAASLEFGLSPPRFTADTT